jgi:hypothetical protein
MGTTGKVNRGIYGIRGKEVRISVFAKEFAGSDIVTLPDGRGSVGWRFMLGGRWVGGSPRI